MANISTDKSMHGRAGGLFVVMAVAFIGLSVRLFTVQVWANERYEKWRDDQSAAVVDVRAVRGPICCRRGEYVAISVPVPSIFAVPKQVRDPAAISAALGFDVRPKLDPAKQFVWLKRRATEAEAAKVVRMEGIGVRTEYLRRYPNGPLLAHVLGMTTIDDEGAEGLEAALNRLLVGNASREAIVVDGARRKLSFPDLPATGLDVQLTIDMALQRIVEEELDRACAEKRPKWAVVVAMDPKTGAILALANRPVFDPNERVGDPRVHQNLAVMAPYEPGSTWKPFCVAGALEERLLTPKTLIDCEMGIWKYGPRVLHDHHPYGRLSVSDVISKSSNIGAAKVGVLLGRERLWKWADAFGFGTRTGIELPLEDGGRLVPLGKWSVYTTTSVPMGHEISVTVLQLVTAMSAIANGGKLMRPYVVQRTTGPAGEELWRAKPEVARVVLSPETSAMMRDMLAEVVKTGTGGKAKIDGVSVAGKTGTTQKIDPVTRQYTHEKFISSFVGFAPAEAPKVCIAVVIDEPQGEYYGGAVAAPVVGNILKRGLPHLK